MSKNYSLQTVDKENIDVTVYGEKNLPNGKIIVFVHGFKGFKDWGFGPYLGEFFSNKGFFVLTFNFSLNGVPAGSQNFEEPEKFAQNSISREVKELIFVIDSLKSGKFGTLPGSYRIGLLGHSRGGGVSILAGSGCEHVSAVATWSAVSTFDRYSERQKLQWHENGYFEVQNARTGQIMRMNIEYLKDIEENGSDALNVLKAVEKMGKPLLLVHGEQDLAVPVKEADLLYEKSNKRSSELLILPATGHTFDIKHPFESSNKKFDKILEKTLKFFEKNIG